MNPMDIVLEQSSYEEIINFTKNIKSTLFPSFEFESEDAINKFALDTHKEWNATNIDELLFLISSIHLTYKYCAWCRDYSSPNVINSLHIKGNAGKYRGCLCKSCDDIEVIIKKYKRNYDKVNYLFSKINHKIYYDKDWCTKCIYEWYI